MSDDFDTTIDAAVAEQTVEATPEPTPEQAQEEAPQPQEEEAPQEETDSGDNEKAEGETIEFPKKAVNAISRRDKKINKLVAERNEYQSKLEAMEQRLSSLESPAPVEPSMDNYDTFEDYIKAVAKYEGTANKEPEAPKGNEQDAVATARQQIEFEQRQKDIATKASELVQKLPDYNNMLVENQDIIETLPNAVQEAILYADNGPLAVYTLAKQDALESLATMNPQQAAMAVARAEIEGKRYLEARPVTKAPAPAQGVKGATGRSSKPIAHQSADELLKWINE